MTAKDDAAWMNGILDAAHPLLDRGAGVFVTLSRIGAGPTIDPRGVAGRGVPDWFSEAVGRIGASMPPAAVERTMFGRPVLLMSRSLGSPQALPFSAPAAARMKVVDVLGVIGRDPSGTCGMIGVPLRKETSLDASTTRRWSRVAAHLVSGLRMRWSLEALAEGDAILEPNGKVVHAEGTARARASRDALRDAATAIDRARGRMRRREPDEAIEIWRGLVDGRWTLVDTYESDGRRYLVARRNAPRAHAPAALDAVERRVLCYALLGHANKLIAYELGISEPVVSRHLARAANKLGFASRVAMIAALTTAR